MRKLISTSSGALFGIGLLISGMTDTSRVQGWLDIFGQWDPTLAFVMGGAIIPMAFAWAVARRMHKPAAGECFPAAPNQDISKELAIGSILFGAGWGLAGLCPGPSLASLSFGGFEGALFLAAMISGMLLAVPLKRVRPGKLRGAS